MIKHTAFAAVAFTTFAFFGLQGACSSGTTTSVPPEGTSGGTSGTSGTSGGADASNDVTRTSDGAPAVCDLAAVAGAAKVDATFAIYDPPNTVPVATTGGALVGKFKVTKAKVFLPTGTKGLADPAKSKGSVTGWAVFTEPGGYRIKLDADLTINSVLGDRPQKIAVDSQGGFTVTGDALKVDQACDAPDSGTNAAYTFTAAGDTATLVVKTPVETFGDAYLEIEATTK